MVWLGGGDEVMAGITMQISKIRIMAMIVHSLDDGNYDDYEDYEIVMVS